jgi:hypothetical protein
MSHAETFPGSNFKPLYFVCSKRDWLNVLDYNAKVFLNTSITPWSMYQHAEVTSGGVKIISSFSLG